jgi:hypothetical protein
MKTLKKIYENYNFPDGNGDKGTAHTYIDEYEKILKPFRKDGSILEIGISWGLSLRMWREYFINGIAYFAASLNSIVFVLEAVVFEVTTTDTLYNMPVVKPVIVTTLVKLVEEMLLLKAVVLSDTLISFVSIVTPLAGMAANLTSIF